MTRMQLFAIALYGIVIFYALFTPGWRESSKGTLTNSWHLRVGLALIVLLSIGTACLVFGYLMKVIGAAVLSLGQFLLFI